MMVIGIDLTWLVPKGENGGIKRYLVHLIDWIGREHGSEVVLVLLSISRNHAEVRDLARPHDSVVCIRDDGIGVVPCYGASFPSEVFDPAWPTRRQEIDLCYCPFAEVSAAPPEAPVIVLVHDLLYEARPQDFPPTEVVRRQAAMDAAVNRAQLIQCLSHSMRSEIVASLQVDPNKAFVTPLFLPRSPITTEPTPLPPIPQAHRNAYFFYPANAWPHKGHDMLLRAYAAAVQTRPDVWPLVLTGHADERMHAVAQLASSLKITERCTFLGFVDDETLTALLGAAGALLFPSLYEGFGIPVYEALAAGLPMAVSNIPVLKETAGDAPLFCQPGDLTAWTRAILILSGDETERLRRATAARTRCEQLDADSCHRILWDSLLRLVPSARPRPEPATSGSAVTDSPATFVGVLDRILAAAAASEAIPLPVIDSMRLVVAAEWKQRIQLSG